MSHCGPVHEYPHFAYTKPPGPQIPLQVGMTITNEPGYYKEGEFGIRIENIMEVVKDNRSDKFLKFRSMTLVPYCKNLIDRQLLDRGFSRIIKEYYTRIEKEIGPIIKSRNKQSEIDYFYEELEDYI